MLILLLGKKDLLIATYKGYVANKNRTLKHWYDNGIGNNIMLAGDSHQNWVSDLVWLDESPYDPVTGQGSIGVEFAGTAVSSTGGSGKGTIATRDVTSQQYVANNTALQWQDGYYRGYFHLSVSKERVEACFYGMPESLSHLLP